MASRGRRGTRITTEGIEVDTADVQSYAFQVWEVMHKEAKRKGMALIKDKQYGDGRVILATVAQYIKILGREREWNMSLSKDDGDVSTIRSFLKAAGNVVVLNRIEEYKFRIFVAEKYTDKVMVPVGVSNKETTREKEVEVREVEPSPIIYKCADCKETFDVKDVLTAHRIKKHGVTPATIATINKTEEAEPETVPQITSEQVKEALKFLHDTTLDVITTIALKHDGVVENDKGKATISVYGSEPKDDVTKRVTSALNILDKRGIITRQIKGKRTYVIELTPLGWAVHDYIGTGSFTATPKPVPAPEPTTSSSNTTLGDTTHVYTTYDPAKTGDTRKLNDFETWELFTELEARLTKNTTKPQHKLDEVKDVLEKVMEGKLTPLRALSDIQQIVEESK